MKSAALVTVRPAVALWLSVPIVALTVKVALPSGVLLVVLICSTLVPGPAGLGVKLKVVPAGKPVQFRLTA